MGRRRRLKKSDGGELEINRQDLAASDEAMFLPSVVALDAGGAQVLLHQMREVPNKMLIHQMREVPSKMLISIILVHQMK